MTSKMSSPTHYCTIKTYLRSSKNNSKKQSSSREREKKSKKGKNSARGNKFRIKFFPKLKEKRKKRKPDNKWNSSILTNTRPLLPIIINFRTKTSLMTST